MAGAGNRWWGPRSDFPWEEDALKHIRDQMPNAEPYRAWQTFTFTAQSGHVREVDLFIATPGGLFLIEIKSHPGCAVNQGATWLFQGGDRLRTIENPLHATDRKCKELKAQLEWAARKVDPRIRIPFIQPAVRAHRGRRRCHSLPVSPPAPAHLRRMRITVDTTEHRRQAAAAAERARGRRCALRKGTGNGRTGPGAERPARPVNRRDRLHPQGLRPGGPPGL